MQQIAPTLYIAQAGEKVTIEVQATKVGLFVFLSHNSALVPPTTTSPLVFDITIAGASGGFDFAVVSCHFPAGAPADASYQLFLTGSAGGGRFTDSKIQAGDAVWDRDLTFKVA
jgi:hypothetical protein